MAFNMDPKKCPMPTQDPNVRNKNFEEVALGYTEEMAVNEAKRCIHCKNKPCQTGCPVGIDIPEFIGHVAEGDFEAAAVWTFSRCQSATKRSRRPMPTGSFLMPRVHLPSHWLSWGQTRPQTAGREEERLMT